MTGLLDDPIAVVPRELGDRDARLYEERTVAELRGALIGERDGLIEVDHVELVGSRPDTVVVFRYHCRPHHVGRAPGLEPGPQTEIARLWEFAVDPDDRGTAATMHGPGVLAAAIGSAFEAAELESADPVTLAPTGRPPRIFPRL